VSHSFIATANAIRHCGAEPVFVDIDPESYNMDPDMLLKCLNEDCVVKNGGIYFRHTHCIDAGESPLRAYGAKDNESFGRVAAILPVHQMGFPCEMRRINSIAEDFDLTVLEDAACAAGSKIVSGDGIAVERIGKPHGVAACFSFHPRKILTTGDGGMITTNDANLNTRLKLLRQHGMSVPDTVRHYAKSVIFEEYTTTGYNYRLTDIQAAVGIEQLKRIESFLAERRLLARAYEAALDGVPDLGVPSTGEWEMANWQSYPVRLKNAMTGKQKIVMQGLLENGIATRRGIMNAHQEKAYANRDWRLPESEHSRDNVILLPMYNGMGTDKAHTVANAVKQILKYAR
jgi:dTDP-4-amino-4,6-dideoxygalactose transaminase